MTWATPFGSEVAQVRSPGSLHNRWCCDPELKPPSVFMPMREQMTRQKSAITIAQPQAKLSWFFMHPRSMLAAVELAGLDVSICTALPMPGEKIL
ncbi:hypothetical protein BRO06_18390 [Xanthomonas oryzae pv. oryzae]|nr:hypothetical protein BRO06_18390 [Xanthomonas oryzae pv. oryzae]